MASLPVVELKCTVCGTVSAYNNDEPGTLKHEWCARCKKSTAHMVVQFELTNGRGCDRIKYNEKEESK